MAAKREYVATFAIGAKLLGSFRGAMSAAQSRLRSLQAHAKRATASVFGLRAAFGGLFALIGGFAVGKIFGKIFHGASEEAMAVQQRTRSLLVSLMQLDSIRKKGPKEAQKQLQLIYKHNKALEEQGVLHHTLLDQMAVQIARGHIPPKQLQQTVEKLGDVLVATSPLGPMATLQEANKLAFAFVKAAASGKLLGLQKQGVIFTKEQQKAFGKLANEAQRYSKLMEFLKENYGAVNKESRNTDVGAIQLFQNALTTMSEDMGEKLLPAQAEMARAWKDALPEIAPLLLTTMKLVLSLVTKLGRTVRTQLLPWWHEFQKSERFKQLQTILEWCQGHIPEIAKGVAVLVGALVGLNVLTSLATIVIGLSSPVGAFTAVVVLLAAAIYELYVHWNELLKVPYLGKILEGFQDAAKTGIALLNALGATIAAVFTGNWKAAGEAWRTVWEAIVAQVRWAIGLILPDLKSAVAGMFELIDKFKEGWQWITSWSRIKKSIGDLTSTDLSKGTGAPGFATGGIIRRPIVAKIGEAGPEAVIPLKPAARSYALLSTAARMLGRRVTPGSAFARPTPMAAGGIVVPDMEGNTHRSLGQIVQNLGRSVLGGPKELQTTARERKTLGQLVHELGRYFLGPPKELQKLAEGAIVDPNKSTDPIFNAINSLSTNAPAGPDPIFEFLNNLPSRLAKAYRAMPPVDVPGAIGRSLNQYLMPGVNFPAPTPYPTGPGAIASGDVGRAWKSIKDSWADKMLETFHPSQWVAKEKMLHPHTGYHRPAWLQRFLGPPNEWEKERQKLPKWMGGGGGPSPTPKPSRYMGVSASPSTINFAPNITINGNASEEHLQALETRLRSVARQFTADFKRAQGHERRLSYEGGYG